MLPDYVQKYKQKGYKIKCKNNHYYLYKVSSSRVKGMKYPQEKDIYLGVINENGLCKPKKIAKTYKVYEYGLSMYLLKLSDNLFDEYAPSVVIKAALSLIYGVYIYQYHYDNSYLSIMYPNIRIDKLKQVEKEVSHKILSKINYNEYGLLFGLMAIKVDDKWVLSEIKPETKKLIEKYGMEI